MENLTEHQSSAKTLSEIRAQIELLQKQEKELVESQRSAAISEVKNLIAAFQITPSEIGIAERVRAPKSSSGRKGRPSKSGAKVMYRDGDNTWSGGRGRKPAWVLEKIEAGEDIEKYRV